MIVRSNECVTIPQIPLHEALFINLEEYKDRVAVIEGVSSQSFTYQQMYDGMRSVGSALTRLGIKKGEVVTFYAPNSINYCLATLGCFSIGAVFSAVNYNYTQGELAHQLLDSKPRVVVTVSSNLPTLNKVRSNKDITVEHIITLDSKVPDTLYFEDLLKDDGSAYPANLCIDVFEDVAALMYSSGTTGLPKGVMLTHFNVVANITTLMVPGLLPPPKAGEQHANLLFLPMFHMYGMMIFLFTMSFGGKVVVLAGFRPETFLKTVQDHKVTIMNLVPPIVVFLAKTPLLEKYDLSSVLSVGSGAAPLTKDVEQSFLERLKLRRITQGYGMTEMTTVTTSGKYTMASKPGSSGRLVANTIAKVVDIQTGDDKELGEEGEICVQGPQMLKGYLNRPDATAALFDEDGWLHTGDVGYFDKDEELFVTGRIKELIKHKGFQVAPAEVEGVIMKHPGILDAAVVGLPDESAGELPRAFVVKRPNTEVSTEDIYDFVKDRLSRHKWLSGGVEFVESIPKTASGKIIRSEVKKMLKQENVQKVE